MQKNNTKKVRTVYLQNGNPIHFDAGTSDEDIELTLRGIRKEEFDAHGGMGRTTNNLYNGEGKSKTVSLDMTGVPEPGPEEEEGEGYLMTDGASDLTSGVAAYYGAKAGFAAPVPMALKPWTALGTGAVAAGAAMLPGEAIQYGIQKANNSPLGDRNAEEVLTTAFEKGGKAALADLVIGTVFNRVAAGWKFVTSPRGKESLEKLQKMLTQSGTTLSLSQALDDTIIGGIIRGTEELLRGAAWTRLPYHKLDLKQDAAFLEYTKNVAAAVSDNAVGKFRPGMFGRYVKALHDRGNRMHKEASALLFRQLDELQPSIYKMEKSVTDISTPGDKSVGYVRKETTEKLVARAPVDVSSVRKFSKDAAKQLEEIGLPEMGPEGYTLLKNMAKGKKDLTFAQTHKLLSGLKTIQRSGKMKGTPGSKELASLIEQVDKAFTVAGDALGGDITKQYAFARDFYKHGQKAFNNELIEKLLKKAPSEIGTALGKDATIEDVKAVRRMVLHASKVPGSKIAYKKTMQKVTHGIVEELLPRHVENFDNAPIFKISTDAKLEDRLIAMIGPEDTETLRVAGTTLKKLLGERGEKGAWTSRQVSAIANAGSVALGAGVAATAGIPAALGAVFAIPYVSSVLFTWPKFVNALVAYEKTPVGSAARRRLATKLLMMGTEVLEERNQDEEIIARKERGEFDPQPAGVSE